MSDFTAENSKAIPPGFRLTVLPDGRMEFSQKPDLPLLALLFLGVWLLIWTVGCVVLLLAFLNGGTMDDGSPMPVWFVGIFWFFELIALAILFFILSSGLKLFFDDQTLRIRRSLFGFSREVEVRKTAIEEIRLLESSIRRNDVRMFRLELQADTVVYPLFGVISQQQARWLGELLSGWSRLPLKED